MVDSPGKMLYNRKSRKKQRTVRLVQGEEGELAVKQKKTASMKQKFAYMAVTMVAASLGVFLCLYLVVSGIMGQTRQIMDDNDRNARFQTQMEAEENAFRHWVEGNDGNAREELENRIRETTETVKKLTKKKEPAKPEVYRSLWAIEKSYEVYCVKRDEAMEMDRSKAEFSRALYEIYDMQGYLIQYGGNLTQAVMKEGNRAYLQGENRFKLIPLVVVFAAVMIAGIAVYAGKYIDRFLIEPIVALSGEAERVAANDFEGQLPGYDQDDEMGHLLKAFGKMKESTQESLRTIQENSELQIQLEKVQLQMLKSQVNPHFLFNTLNMISCMAQLEEADTTDKMILAMSRLFQYTLKSSESTAPLSNEIAVVKDYLYLQKMRFGERVQYEIDVEDDTEYRMVPSFILQPLVENAVIHGISGQASGGFIRVRSWTEGKKLWLSVEDTGAGMEPEQVEQLNSGKWKGKSGHGVGLGNIIKRVRIMYQDGQVIVRSEKKKGTCITIGFTDTKGEI